MMGRISHRWISTMLVSIFLGSLCLSLSSAFGTSGDFTCPPHCDCDMTKAETSIKISCFVWDLKELDFRSFVSIASNVSLTINCDSAVPADLTDDIFNYINSMQTLFLNKCKISYIHKNVFAGQRNLKSIELYSASNFHLQIHPEVFKSVPNVETLVITNSGVLNITNLCILGKLRFLNISGNSLKLFKDTGLACDTNTLNALNVMDISNNQFTTLSQLKYYGAAFPKLETFHAAGNEISFSPDDNLFSHFLDLRILNLAKNNINTLPASIIERNTHLEDINLSENNIHNLPDEIFQHSKRLLRIQLQRNNIDDFVWLRLIDLKRIMLLDMSSNNLTNINHTLISLLTQLSYLNLANNKIGTFEVNAFENLIQLRGLNLAGNRIYTMDNGVLNGLLYLTKLELQENYIYSMNVDILNSLTALTHLNLSSNFLMDIPTLQKLSNLFVFDASDNNLEALPENMFIGQRNIRDINLSRNNLETIPDSIFLSCQSLENLDLSNNRIKYIHPSLLMGLKLQKLMLHDNQIQSMGRTFANMAQLQELNLSNNDLRDTVQRNTFPVGIEMLDLSYNKIKYIRPQAFDGLGQVRIINLRYNHISTLSKDALTVSTGMYAQTGFMIDENPLKCDCNLLWLKKWDQSKRGPTIVNINGTRCNGAYDYPESPIYAIPEDRFLCQYDTMCPQNCPCCAFEACDCKYKCPQKCGCYTSADYKTIHYVTCSKQNLTTFDQFIPRMATQLDMSGNSLDIVPSYGFLGMTHLKTLLLNHSKIENLQNRSFVGLVALEHLYLDYNAIRALRNGMFKDLTSLQSLYLDHNHISYLQTGVFDLLLELKTLRLSNNHLQHMDDYTSHITFRIRDLELFSNPWSCDCILYFSAKENPSAFMNTTEIYHAVVPPIECYVNSFQRNNKIVYLTEYSDICEDNKKNDHVEDLTSSNQVGNADDFNKSASNDSSVTSENMNRNHFDTRLKIFVPVIVASTLIIILVISVICRRDLVRCWLFTKYKCGTQDIELTYDKSRHYDAYIAYHAHDNNYVIRELVLRLERGKPNYRLLVHHRDCPAGSSVPHFIENAVTSSHRTVIVLSSDHVYDNVWLKYITQCVKQDSIKRLILVVIGKIDKMKLDPAIVSYMKTDQCIKTKDTWFWEKLFHCLPEPGKVDRDSARAEARPYASTDLARLSSSMMDNRAYEESLSMSSRPLPTVTEYVPPSETSNTYDYAAGSQRSSNIYEEIKETAKYNEPWRNIVINSETFTPKPAVDV